MSAVEQAAVDLKSKKLPIEIRYTYSEKGNKCLVLDGHIFYKDRVTNDGVMYWRCSQYKSHCRKRIHTSQDKVNHIIGEHNHELFVKVNNVAARPSRRMTKGWANKDTIHLIKIYEKYYLLWDPTNQDYKDKRKRLDAILEIANTFQTTKEQIYIKIHNLRNQFSNELKKYKNKIPIIPDYKSKWIYFDLLKFLDIENLPSQPDYPCLNFDIMPIKKEKPDDLSVDNENINEYCTYQYDEMPSSSNRIERVQEMSSFTNINYSSANQENIQCDSIINDNLPTFMASKKRKYDEMETDSRDFQGSSLSSSLPCLNSDEREYEYFGKYIASQLKQLPTDISIELQMEIQALIGQKRLNLIRNVSNRRRGGRQSSNDSFKGDSENRSINPGSPNPNVSFDMYE